MSVRRHRQGTLLARLLVGSALVLATIGINAAPGGAARQFTTSTTVTTSANPALAGDPVTFTATVTILGHAVGPATPKGTVTFSVDGTKVGTVPVGDSCVSRQCSATITITAPPEDADGHLVTARYDGDVLSRPSTGTLVQHTKDPVPCQADEICSGSATAADGSARLFVQTNGDAAGAYTIEVSFQEAALSCTQPGTGDTGVFDVTDPQATKRVTYTSYGAAATANAENPNRVCWSADAPFTTADGTPAPLVNGWYEGLLPLCPVDSGGGDDDKHGHGGHGSDHPGKGKGHDGDGDGGVVDPAAGAPCVESSSQSVTEGGVPTLTVTVRAPAGDPRVTR